MEILRELIQKLLDDDVIEQSMSPYASPCFFVPKPGGKFRLVIDYRKLNKKVESQQSQSPI